MEVGEKRSGHQGPKSGLKVKIRRSKANARERNRMHGLNAALDKLRSRIPIQQVKTDMSSEPQKLSKIETLRLARNYINAMSQTLQEGSPMDMHRFTDILCKELSQATANLLTATLMRHVNNHLTYHKILEIDKTYPNGDLSDLAYYNNNYNNGSVLNYEYNSQFYMGTFDSYWPSCRLSDECKTRSNMKHWNGVYNESYLQQNYYY